MIFYKMELSKSFTSLFDRAVERSHVSCSSDAWVVYEHDRASTMTKLSVMAEGEFCGFDCGLVKNIKDITTTMSSNLYDKDCDGIAFYNDPYGTEHLVFAELKSTFDVSKLREAFRQITMSFIKMHAWLSLCGHYNLSDVGIHFIAACKCFKDDDQRDNVLMRISQQRMLDDNCFESRFLFPLLKNGCIKVSLNRINDITKLPFNDCIKRKDATIYLKVTDSFSDKETKVKLRLE